mmetsp:Transcript_29826/g.33897  ORF Transcript_29826/g.33897 Transcript_29826/m.33897 type:complete len:120 (-) Transcript_29826:856-1215(-)
MDDREGEQVEVSKVMEEDINPVLVDASDATDGEPERRNSAFLRQAMQTEGFKKVLFDIPQQKKNETRSRLQNTPLPARASISEKDAFNAVLNGNVIASMFIVFIIFLWVTRLLEQFIEF